MTSPNPPQRTAASRDPWSPLAENGGSGSGQQGADPWGGMGPIISSSTIPDPWGGIGGVGVPPSRGSPLVFSGVSGVSSTSPPSAAKTNPDPWNAPAPSNNDPWGAPAVPETQAKGETGSDIKLDIYPVIAADPFSPAGGTGDPNDIMAAFGGAGNSNGGGAGSVPANPWDMGGLDPLPLLGPGNVQVGGHSGSHQLKVMFQSTGAKPRSAVENLLGEHSALVNLDSLEDNKRTTGAAPAAKNPFAEQPNPFQAAAAPKPSMNQLRGGNQVSWQSYQTPHFTLSFQPSAGVGGGWPSQAGSNTNTDINPFF